jgi:protocatechuate 3,4-dioxygenase beta subunit
MPRNIWSIVLLAALIPAVAAAQTTPPAGGRAGGTARPGLPPRDTPAATAAKPATGKIRGRVLAAESNAPLRRAQVTLLAGQMGVRRMTTTDGDGRYEFTEVAEGRYNMLAGKGGYVTLQFGQRRAFEPGTQVAVADGQDLTQVDFVLPRGSVIAGRVTDEFGEPIAGAQIQVQRYQYTPGGQRRLVFAGGNGFVQTDDRGEFRAYGLMPGGYIVSGTVRQPMAQGSANTNDATEGYAPTFYPGTPNPAEAEVLTLGLAQEMSIQLTLQAARMARITGTVTDSNGQPLRDGRVIVRSASGDGMMFNATGGAINAAGAFALSNVPPGDHFIEVVTQGRGRSDAAPESASVQVQVSSEDIDGLRLTTAPAASISGVVVFEGESSRNGVLGGLRVTTQSAEPQRQMPFLGGFDERGRVGDDGRFELRGTGKVFIRPINLGPWMLKRVTLQGEDITDEPLDLTGVANVEGLRVVLTDRLTDVSGVVRDDRKQSVKEFVVVMQPASEVAANALQRFLRSARPDQDGKFGLKGIPPAEYIVTAVEALEQGEEWNPDYRARLREAGRRFTVKEGETLTLDLELSQGL